MSLQISWPSSFPTHSLSQNHTSCSAHIPIKAHDFTLSLGSPTVWKTTSTSWHFFMRLPGGGGSGWPWATAARRVLRKTSFIWEEVPFGEDWHLMSLLSTTRGARKGLYFNSGRFYMVDPLQTDVNTFHGRMPRIISGASPGLGSLFLGKFPCRER